MEENNENKDPQICFTRGTKDLLVDPQGETKDPKEAIRAFIRDRFHQKNVYFLFGSGTSAPALPLMRGLYEEVEKLFSNEDEGGGLFNKVKQAGDLEKTLGILYSLERYQAGILSSLSEEQQKELEITRNVIGKIQKYIYETLWHPTQKDLEEGQVKPSDVEGQASSNNVYRSTLEVYKSFYQKVVYRNKDLSRIHVFTTNNDLFNEAALDKLGILYTTLL